MEFESPESIKDIFAMLQRQCVRGLEEEHQLVIAGRVSAGNCQKAAMKLSYSRSQTQRRWDEVKDFVLVPLGLTRHDDLLTGIWIVLHQSCCTAPAVLLLKNDSRFASDLA